MLAHAVLKSRGETEPKDDYSWATYKFERGSDYYGPFSKYAASSLYGTIDNKAILDLEDDAAYVNWGGSWRMPTDKEWSELNSFYCNWILTTENGVRGMRVTSITNGNHIFLSAAGYRQCSQHGGARFYGYYWSSLFKMDKSSYAWNAYFASGGVGRLSIYRYRGHPIRPVCE